MIADQNFESYTGWIDRSGKFWPCSQGHHGEVVKLIPKDLLPAVLIPASGFPLWDNTFDVKSLNVAQVTCLQAWCDYHSEDWDEINSSIFMWLPLMETDI